MTIQEFMRAEGLTSAELVKSPTTGKRFVSFNGGRVKTRISAKVVSLASSYVSFFEDTNDYCVVSTQSDNVQDTLTL